MAKKKKFTYTTPKDPGDYTDDGPYTTVRVTRLSIDLETDHIQFTVKHGTVVDDEFVPGKLGNGMVKQYVLHGDEAATFLTRSKAEKAYEDYQDEIFQYLIDTGVLAGTIEA